MRRPSRAELLVVLAPRRPQFFQGKVVVRFILIGFIIWRRPAPGSILASAGCQRSPILWLNVHDEPSPTTKELKPPFTLDASRHKSLTCTRPFLMIETSSTATTLPSTFINSMISGSLPGWAWMTNTWAPTSCRHDHPSGSATSLPMVPGIWCIGSVSVPLQRLKRRLSLDGKTTEKQPIDACCTGQSHASLKRFANSS